MATVEQYKQLVSGLAEHFKFRVDNLHEYVQALVVPGVNNEVARVIFSEADQTIGVAFQIEITPTDAIQVFDYAKGLLMETALFQSYFVDSNGIFSNGMDAQIAAEADRQNRYTKTVREQSRRQAEEEWNLKQLEKAGKVTFH